MGDAAGRDHESARNVLSVFQEVPQHDDRPIQAVRVIAAQLKAHASLLDGADVHPANHSPLASASPVLRHWGAYNNWP